MMIEDNNKMNERNRMTSDIVNNKFDILNQAINEKRNEFLS